MRGDSYRLGRVEGAFFVGHLSCQGHQCRDIDVDILLVNNYNSQKRKEMMKTTEMIDEVTSTEHDITFISCREF